MLERRTSERRPFRKARRALERIEVLGAKVDLVRPEEVMHHVEAAVDAARPYLVANHNLHSLYLLRRTPNLAAFFDDADLIEVDSTPVITFTRALGLQSRPFHRCTYLDWRDHFWSVANRKAWRVYYLGGAPGVAQAAAAQLNSSYPETQIRVRHGYFDASPGSAENAEILADIAAFAPHILFVGMGMPRQEQWVMGNRASLPPCAVFSVGAAFDYEAGVQKAAPRWMGRAGFEWLYRLAHDPVRLWRRYCFEPWFMIAPALRDVGRAFAAGRLLKTPASRPSGRDRRAHLVSEPVPVQGRLNLAENGAQPAPAAELKKAVVAEGPQSRFVDRQKA
ncbi:WecB/TagA/CpsF family glycosyltransferase [Phenylobacterium sp.]|uniref:WecB/TagA/CpsF family glycosyltransferase n=1 Tax=Phenylobacterium sp. TaxID=1871053 RepID=UPI00261D93C0|nr:WecB/TagA/CpsF family glycosyltransferase [Phenylobacterium sp.]